METLVIPLQKGGSVLGQRRYVDRPLYSMSKKRWWKFEIFKGLSNNADSIVWPLAELESIHLIIAQKREIFPEACIGSVRQMKVAISFSEAHGLKNIDAIEFESVVD